MKYPPQMCFTDMAHRSQFLHLDRTVTIFADIANRRCDQTGDSCLEFCLFRFLPIPPCHLQKKSQGQSFHFFQIEFLSFPHAYNDLLHQCSDLGFILNTHKMCSFIHPIDHFLCHPGIVFINFPQKFVRINKQPLPVTDTVSRRVCSMRKVLRYHCKHIAVKGNVFFFKSNGTFPIIAKSNFQMIVKMQVINLPSVILHPFIPQKSKHRTSCRNFIITVFHLWFSFSTHVYFLLSEAVSSFPPY